MSQTSAAQAKATEHSSTGLYVHVPFCARTCDYCAFYQATPEVEAIRAYLESVKKEVTLVEWPERIETVFWGGGTPSLLAAKDIEALASAFIDRLGGEPREWTVEMTPLSVTTARLEVLKAIGVNRISLGIQSFQSNLLEALGRQHTPTQAYRAYDRLRKEGFQNINFDLMFALPGQSLGVWERDLAEAVRLGPEHLSTYCLTFEEDTRLWLKLSKGLIKRDIESETLFYTHTWDFLQTQGYPQYEISNFAREGKACVHNLNTWRMQSWIGLGPSAASQERGWRYTNPADLLVWKKDLEAGQRGLVDRMALNTRLVVEDSLLFGLRMNEGCELPRLLTPLNPADRARVQVTLDRLLTEGLAQIEESKLRLTRKGRLLADSVGAEFAGLLT